MNKRNTLVGPQLQRGRQSLTPDWKRLIAFGVVLLLGSIVATQFLANSYRYHPSLGSNLFHIYPPWSYFVWAHQWDQPGNHALFAQAFSLGSLVTLGGFFVLILDVARRNFRVNPYLHGSARWADVRDIKVAGLLNNDGVYVGAWRDKGVKFTICGMPAPSTFCVTLRPGAGRGLASLCRLRSPGNKACS
jgi:type IV secretion system protein VirD4